MLQILIDLVLDRNAMSIPPKPAYNMVLMMSLMVDVKNVRSAGGLNGISWVRKARARRMSYRLL